MGRAHCLVVDELLERFYANPALHQQVFVLDACAFDDKTQLILVSSDALPEGHHGQ
jgi:hypothetical protein